MNTTKATEATQPKARTTGEPDKRSVTVNLSLQLAAGDLPKVRRHARWDRMSLEDYIARLLHWDADGRFHLSPEQEARILAAAVNNIPQRKQALAKALGCRVPDLDAMVEAAGIAAIEERLASDGRIVLPLTFTTEAPALADGNGGAR